MPTCERLPAIGAAPGEVQNGGDDRIRSAVTSIFLSHSSKDDERAAWLRDRLAEQGYEALFLDFDPERGIPAGRRWELELYRQLSTCKAVIFLCTRNWSESRWCFAEAVAAKMQGKELYPLEFEPDSVPVVLKDRQVVRFGRDPAEGLKRLWAGLRRSGLDPRDDFAWDPAREPYPGFAALDLQDAAVFFGRSDETRAVLDLVNALWYRREDPTGPRLVAIIGASGSGKSSLARAGVLARLAKQPDRWFVLPPVEASAGELRGLAESLAPGAPDPALPTELREALSALRCVLLGAKEDRDSAIPAAAATEGPFPRGPVPVLLIDQFEQLLVASAPADSPAPLDRLRRALRLGPHRPLVLITLRSDHLASFQQYAGTEELPYVPYLLGPMTSASLADAIAKPAERAGLRLAPALAEKLREDFRGEGSLPLLAFVLREIYERRAGGEELALDLYDQAAGLRGFLERRSALVLAGHSAGAHRRLRDALIMMVEAGEGGQLLRRSVRMVDIPREALPLVRELVNQRFLVARDDELTIAHDRLLVEWDLLRQASDEYAHLIRWRSRLREARETWLQFGAHEDQLLTEAALPEAESMLAHHRELLNEDDISFVARSLNRRDRRLESEELARRKELEHAKALAEAERRRAEESQRLLRIAEAERERAKAEEARAHLQRLKATVARLAADSRNELPQRLDLALLLAVAGLGILQEPDSECVGALLSALQSKPRLEAYLHHADRIRAMALTPDGRLLAVGEEASVVLWNLASRRRCDDRLIRHGARVSCLAISPDGRSLASGCEDGVVRLWDLRSGRPKGEPLQGHRKSVLDIAFHPEGRQLVTAAVDGSVLLWNLASSPIAGEVLKGPTEMVVTVAFSSDGRFLACGSWDREGTIFLWNLEQAKRAPVRLKADAGQVNVVVFDKFGKRLAAGHYRGQIVMWDLVSPKRPRPAVRTSVDTAVESLAFSTDGFSLLAGLYTGDLRLLDAETLEPTGEPLIGHTGSIEVIATGPDSARVASGSDDETVLLWNLNGRDRLYRTLAAHTEPVFCLAYHPDGRRLVTGSEDRTVLVWDLTTLKPRGRALSLKGIARCLAYTADGRMLAIGSGDGSLYLCDSSGPPALGRPLKRHEESIQCAAFDPGGALCATGGEDGSLIVWDIARRKPLIEVPEAHRREVTSVAFDPTGQYLASAGRGDEPVRLWALDDIPGMGRADSSILEGAQGSALAFSPDGTLLAVADDQQVVLWDFRARTRSGAPLVGFRDVVVSLAFSPNGNLLLTGRLEKPPLLWGVPSRKPIGSLEDEHFGAAWGVAFRPDGAQAAVVRAGANVVALWDLDIESWKSRARSVANRNLTIAEWRQYLGDLPYRAAFADLPDMHESASPSDGAYDLTTGLER